MIRNCMRLYGASSRRDKMLVRHSRISMSKPFDFVIMLVSILSSFRRVRKWWWIEMTRCELEFMDLTNIHSSSTTFFLKKKEVRSRFI